MIPSCGQIAGAIALLCISCSSSDAPKSRRHIDAGSPETDATTPASGGASAGGAPGSSGQAASSGSGSSAGGARSREAGVTSAGGTSTADASTEPDSATPASGPRVADFVGINGFIDDDVTKLAAVGNVREYHQWSWNDGNGEPGYPGYPKNELQFSLWNGFWDFDDYYRKLTQARAMVFPCLQGSVDYLKSAMPPVANGADTTSPASYVAHASFLYQYAARYGRVTVSPSLLKLAADQKALSGLGLLPYYENGNEPDATWVKPDGSFLFSPEETAAMTSADYDGHRGSLGAGVGLKSADPQAKLVLAGLAGAGKGEWATNVTTYLDGIRAWAAKERGGSFPADVLNVHEYCFGPDPFGTANPRPGISPEECGLEGLLAKIAHYRDVSLPGKEVWLTEFGYDTHPRSRLRAPAIGDASAEVVQGQWLVRGVLALFASGIDRAFLYISRDSCTGTDAACPDNAVQFSTSGVLTQKGDETPKASWFFLATLRSRLGSMRYLGTTASGNARVSVARFYDASAKKGAYVVWAPTSDGSVVRGYSLAVAPSITTASLVTLVDKQANGTLANAAVSAGHVSVDVTETPSFVLVDGAP